MTIYRWTEISGIPQEPGIYAWYYSPEITDYDLELAIEKINKFKQNNEREYAAKIIENFLEKNIFQYFQEEPYQAFLEGSLKPTYKGYLEHKPIISDSLVSRILEEPERLKTVKNVVQSSAPNFASPIYIGMSDKLGKRLNQHKRLIEKYREEIFKENTKIKDKENIDQSFAMEVCRRNILPAQLFVVINIIKDNGKRYIDLENILNRIHYPLLGRN
ncbi:hypothetical protein [Nostoc sp. PCC 7107]|uniref:hypothetical protein n=1 Tax=Nostoc sp. PCC 7107 TaxID=317936 RepID=UPI00029EEB7F|nr:hypothetical protein [Nostoc sp. PCC 7107]AFY44924.1 hypothetical protein Nos7107_4389 [Nostoc sp. PCC 7107]